MIKLLREKNALLVSEQALAKANVENIQLFITILTITIALLLLWAGRLWKSHKRVKQLAEYDTLTGIFSRGHFTQITTSALSYCKNAQQPLSLIMFDLDFFKKVNDSYGHACGDWVLKEVVRVCKATGRTNDIFARVGGEEFCLVLPSCQLNAAIERAETCRAAIESINTSATGHNFSVSASFGVTDAKHSGYTLDNLLANADLAAYQAKHNGRNKVSVFK
jgi:diguanylate cyclase (GGDEF)-like protein